MPVGDPRVTGDTVLAASNFFLDEWRRLGVAPLEVRSETVVQAGKIKSVVGTLSPESAARLPAATAAGQRPPAQVPRALPRTGEAFDVRAVLAAAGTSAVMAGFALRARYRTHRPHD